MKKLMSFFLLLLAVHIQSAYSIPSDLSLDQVLTQLSQNREHSPFKRGETIVRRHPLYSDMVALARTYNTKVVWATSVPGEVLQFPYNDERIKVDMTWELEGWFDEFTSPNVIILDRQTYLSTLMHEIRHAIQLGSHGKISGNWFDKLLQSNKKKAAQFQARLKKMKISEKQRKHLHMQATRLIEMCSEINAHSDEIKLARAHKNQEQTSNNRDFVEEYKAEYTKAYKALKASEFSKNEAFIESVDEGLDRFLKQ